MQERQRQEMLQAMGVAVLLPRFAFAGAKASNVFAAAVIAKHEPVAIETQTFASEAVALEQPPAEAKNSPPLKSLKDIVALSGGHNVTIEKKTLRKSSLRYRHRIIACESIIFVVDQPELEWQQADKKLLFMQDIYRALFAKPYESIKQEVFSWPITGIDDSHAKATERAFIQSLAEQYQARCVLLFSKDLAPLLVDDGKIDNLPCVSLHSIEHYWQQPLAKAELWQSLQSVGQTIAGT